MNIKKAAINKDFNKRYAMDYVDRTHTFFERIVDFIVYYITMFCGDSKTMTLMDCGGGTADIRYYSQNTLEGFSALIYQKEA